MPKKKPKKLSPAPPQWPDKLLEWFCAPHLQEEVMGDLHERYYLRVKTLGVGKARRLYLREVLAYMRPQIFKRKKSYHSKLNFTDMLGYYLKIAFRNLKSKKFYSFINILGLSIGMTCCLLIFQFVVFEYSFDTFHEKGPNLYRIIQTSTKGGREPDTNALNGWAMGPAMAEEVPEVINFARLHPEYDNAFVSNPAQPDKVFEERRVFYADASFVHMFSYPIISGNPAHALAEPGTVILSESAARKYFGSDEPLGQTLDINGWISGTYRVNGIFKEVPANSHLQFDILLPMIDLLKKSRFNNPETGWGWQNFITYVQLHNNADPATVKHKFTEIFARNRGEVLRESNTTVILEPQPLAEIHLNDDTWAPNTVMGSYESVYFFGVIGLITLLIALVNYINLTTARALDRALEVGIRKVSGARRRQLIVQFLSESASTILIVFILAMVLAETFRPVINTVAAINIPRISWTNPGFWVVFFIFFCIATLTAGLYPAFALSSFMPASVLKGKSRRSATDTSLRRVLVVLQFTISITLLVGTSIVYNQLNYAKNMDLGIDLEQIMTISSPRVLPEGENRTNAVETFAHELKRLPAVLKTSTSSAVPGKGFSFYTSSIRQAGADPTTAVPGVTASIDTAFADLYGLKLLVGEGFKNILNPSPEDGPRPVIANETAVKNLGFSSPSEALGREVDIGGNIGYLNGVYEDFHWSSAHNLRENIFFFLGRANLHISVKVHSGNLAQTITTIEKVYKQQFPGNPFQFAFADKTFEAQYQNDRRFARLFGIFAALAIFIACMGLFALATFTARQRNKEIGIRKAMGATAANIVALLNKEFLKLVMIGFLIAIPIAWYIMNQWLQDFAYRIEIHPGLFLLAGFVAILIALTTVSWQSIKAALKNPVDSLRDE